MYDSPTTPALVGFHHTSLVVSRAATRGTYAPGELHWLRENDLDAVWPPAASSLFDVCDPHGSVVEADLTLEAARAYASLRHPHSAICECDTDNTIPVWSCHARLHVLAHVPPASPQTPEEQHYQEQMALGAPNGNETPRWTLAPGRWICYDGKPLVYLGVGENPTTAERSCPPYAANDLAHLIVHLLASSYLPGISNDPLSFPVPERVAAAARAATPTTLPGEEVARG